MSSSETLDESQALVTYRPVVKSEQTKAIELWQTVFEAKGDGDFERYFLSTASSYYQEGDTLGTWPDNDLLVGVVYLRRMILRSANNNETFLCNVVSNVATREEFRNRGLSRELLLQAIDKIER